jgi:hypothetical protein
MTNRFRKAVRWYTGQPSRRRATLRALPITLVTYCTALLAGVVAKSLDIKGIWAFAFVTAAIVAFVGVVVVASQAVIEGVEAIQAEGVRQREVLSSAHELADGWMLDELKNLAEVRAGSAQPKFLAPADPITALNRLTQAAFTALTAHYGQAERTADRIDFEVTFMTKSYVDSGITIPAWANRDGRKPTSMQRRNGNPMLYERSITADVYRAETPDMRIISDTADPQSNYAEIYPDQRQRIRSSIVYPILSSEYELLGTLVLHCDKPGFFIDEDRKFWRDFCELFAKRIALEKQLLDKATIPSSEEQLGPGAWEHPPF